MRRVLLIGAMLLAACTTPSPATAPPTTPAPTSPTPPTTVKATTTTTSTTTTIGVFDEVDLPEGWVVLDHAAAGFVVGVPSGWVEIDMAAGDFDAIAADLGDSSIVEILRTQAALLESAELFAYDAGAVGFATNLNVLEFPTPGLTAELLAEALPAQLGAIGANVDSVDVVTLGINQAVRITYTLPGDQVGRSGDLTGAAMYVLTGATAWAITYSTDDPARVAEFDRIVATFLTVP